MSRPASGEWLVEWPARMAPLADLLCFAGAGAGTAPFRGWPARLPAFVSVLAGCLPGREARIAEPFAPSLEAAADCFAEAYLERRNLERRAGPRRLVLFGHSLGAVIAFQVARRLVGQGRPADCLILAASAPPSGAGGAEVDPDALRALILGYDSANARITENAELFEALGPIIAADIALLRSHAVGAGGIDTPAVILSGVADKIVPAEAAAAWGGHLTGRTDARTFPGGHFFPFREAEAETLALLGRCLSGQA